MAAEGLGESAHPKHFVFVNDALSNIPSFYAQIWGQHSHPRLELPKDHWRHLQVEI